MSLFFLAFSLLGCDEPVTLPHNAEARQLDVGQWEVQVLNAAATRGCDIRPQDLVGQALYGDLAMRGDQVVFELEGARLIGEIHGSSLYVEGALPGGGRPDRPPIATHPQPEEGDDADSSGGDTGGAPAGDANTARGDRGDSHADPRPDAGFASLDAEILSRRLANGMLSVSMGRCELDLKVVLAYVGDDRGVVVVQEDDTDTEPPSDEPVDSDDAK